MDFLAPVRRFDAYQQRRRWLALPVAVFKKFGDDQGGSLAALVAYYAFFSLFPLLLVFTTILGFVLRDNPGAQQSVEKSVLHQLPIIGNQIQLHSLKGSVVALVIGLVTSLLAGLGVTGAAQNAMDRVWAVPFKERPNFLQSRIRGLGLLTFLGLLFIVSTAASGIVSGGFGGVGDLIVGYVIALVVNLALFFAAFRLMTVSVIPHRDLRVGVVVAAVLWTILQALGGYYIGHVLNKQGDAGKTFGLVIALLVWLHLGAQVMLYSAEINVVVTRRLWPRSLFGPPEAPADKRTLRALAKVEERSDQQHIDVAFETAPPAGARETPPGEDA
ncbi:MAG: YihY/virulence factor BrkB family protein [Solirubrobacteraceae bacterium]